MKRFLSLLPLALLSWLVGTVCPASAQAPAMSLMGSVKSDEQRPLPGTAITVIHLPSGVRRVTAADAAGRFVIPNLMVGGPYVIRVGGGGYHPQIVENIFLETGKMANYAVVLSKVEAKGKPGKSRSNRPAPKTTSTLALAPEAVVGGPVLMTTMTGQPRSSARAAAPATSSFSVVSTTPAPALPAASSAPSAPAAPAQQPVVASRYRTASRYPARRGSTRASDPVPPGHYDAATGNYIYDTGALTTLTLPGGGVIPGVGVNSTESNLYRFLTDPQMVIDTVDLTRGWYNFDKVFFDTGKATLTGESMGQLRNIAAILKAFPKARIKLGGYTDNTGPYMANRHLSEARAHAAWASLLSMGIGRARVQSRGYGPGYAIAANTSEEGRAKNRRLSLKVVEK